MTTLWNGESADMITPSLLKGQEDSKEKLWPSREQWLSLLDWGK